MLACAWLAARLAARAVASDCTAALADACGAVSPSFPPHAARLLPATPPHRRAFLPLHLPACQPNPPNVTKPGIFPTATPQPRDAQLRSDVFGCARCAGEHQLALQRANCTNGDISAWCAGVAPPGPPLPNVSSSFGWANLAWGWKDGGQDTIAGQKIVEYDIDADPAAIRAARAAGHLTICYFSVGTLEPFRADCQANRSAWEAVAVGKMAHWDEQWLDISKLEAIQQLMLPRFQRAAALGCHGVEPDNIDCYDNGACWKKIVPALTKQQAMAKQLAFNRWQTAAAHSLGLVIAMKNAVAIIPQLHDCYDLAINEQCQKYKECGNVQRYFSQRGKAALQVECKIAILSRFACCPSR